VKHTATAVTISSNELLLIMELSSQIGLATKSVHL
jgi:hypothetical protein